MKEYQSLPPLANFDLALQVKYWHISRSAKTVGTSNILLILKNNKVSLTLGTHLFKLTLIPTTMLMMNILKILPWMKMSRIL